MMNRSLQGLILSFISLIFLTGCSDDVSTVGSKLFPPEAVRIDSLTRFAGSSTTYRARIPGNSSTLLLGRYQSQNIEVRLLLDFGLITLPAGISDTSIVSASMKLIPRPYWFKDSTGTFEFTIHKIRREWNEFTVTYDTINGLFYDTSPSGTFSDPVSPRDTLFATVDTALVRDWVRTGKPYGMILLPLAASNVVYGFFSVLDVFSDIRPELIVRYIVPDSVSRIDSVVFRTIQDVFVADNPVPIPSSQVMVVQAGVADRGRLYLDVSAIPNNASITRAELTFVRDASLSVRNEFSVDSIFVQILVDNSNPPRGGTSVLAQPAAQDSSVFTANLERIVQQWVTGQQNYGVALRAFGEFSTLDRFVFYGVGDSIYRPQLRILYSVFQ